MSTDTIKTDKARYKRIGSIKPSKTVKEKLDAIRDEFILTNPPETVGGNLDDEQAVIDCMNKAAEFMHEQLPDKQREHAKRKWGLTDDIINARGIGFVSEESHFIGHLINEGFDKTTIIRASLANKPGLRHLFECNGVSKHNKDILPENRKEAECNNCYHAEAPTKTIEVLVRAQLQGLIEPREIDLKAVISHIDAEMTRNLRNWWDDRITFPYKDDNGDVRYFIVRATGETNDQVYNNGVVDRREEKYTPVSETNLGRKLQEKHGWGDEMNDYCVIPKITRAYSSPNELENEPIVEDIEQVLQEVIDVGAPVQDRYLQRHGLGKVGNVEDTARVHVFESSQVIGDYDTQYVVTPVAVGVNPGDEIMIVNHTTENTEVIIQPCETPTGAYWNENATNGVRSTLTYECSESGSYKYKIKVNGEEHRALAIANDYIDTENRDEAIEQWCDEEPLFEVDLAKYLKQAVSPCWVNNVVVDEPVFGTDTVHEGKPVISAEGIADAVAAQQHSIPAVSSATTHYKTKHYDVLERVCEKASVLVIVNDNDEAGQKGAVKTASEMHNRGYTNVKIGELPPESEVGEIDVADYLKQFSKQEFFDNVLSDLIDPTEHRFYNEDKHDSSTTNIEADNQNNKYNASNTDDEFTQPDDWRESNRSAIYDIPLGEVIDFSEMPFEQSGREIYRGGNPTLGEGTADNDHFRIVRGDNGLKANDFKLGHTYGAQQWLAVMADCECDPDVQCECTRPPERPGYNADNTGIISKSESWWAWRYAKEADHIEYPADDAVPRKAIWFIASYHDVWPEDDIPDSFDDDMLDKYAYNKVLEIIEEEYGLNPGRGKAT